MFERASNIHIDTVKVNLQIDNKVHGECRYVEYVQIVADVDKKGKTQALIITRKNINKETTIPCEMKTNKK